MRVLIINPNTTRSFTEKVFKIASKYKNKNTEVEALNPVKGPRSIECVYDEILSANATLELLLPIINDFDAFIIACYSDHPAIYALREITEKPVIGIAEASMYFACVLGYKFSIVSTNEAWIPLLWDAVKHYGLVERCASVRVNNQPVLALENADGHDERDSIISEARLAVEEDGAEVICLGCAGMSGLDKDLEAVLNVPVLDGVVCALKLVEGLCQYGLNTSKKRAYARPGYKKIDDLPEIFEKPYKQ